MTIWDSLGKRAATMRFALEQLPDKPTIVETGCIRSDSDWQGDGMSTLVFAQWVEAHDGHLWSVDINPTNVAHARAWTTGAQVTVELGDSVAYLLGFTSPIDLLYLDSLDYPYGALLDLYGGKEDLDKAIATLAAMGEEDIIRLHGEVIAPSQEHCANELRAALPNLHERSVVLIDDADLPGGGKARLACRLLRDEGWRCALDAYQTVWVR